MIDPELMKILEGLQKTLFDVNIRTKSIWDIDRRLTKIEDSLSGLERCPDVDLDTRDLERAVSNVDNTVDDIQRTVDEINAALKEAKDNNDTDAILKELLGLVEKFVPEVKPGKPKKKKTIK